MGSSHLSGRHCGFAELLCDVFVLPRQGEDAATESEYEHERQ